MKAYNYAYRGVQCMPMRAAQTQRYTYIYNAWHGERNVQPDVPLQFDGHMDILTGLCWMWMKKEAENDPELAERVEFIRSRAPEEFYDLQADPHCLNNLIDAPEHADKIAELRGHVEQYMVDYGDPLLAKFRGEGPIPRDWLVFTPKEQG
jgi:N-sulfoglucosamine sulfohydrolase